MHTALTIAGSDSGGGAGIQADLKTFAAFQVYGTSALTAITAQNTLGVRSVQTLSSEIVGEQIDAVVEDIGVDAAKTGMLANTEIIRMVAAKAREHKIRKLVVDPVMVAKSGDRLLEVEAAAALVQELFPLALVITPNLEEAEFLLGKPVRSEQEMRQAAAELYKLGPFSVLLKGGHLPGSNAVDLLFDGQEMIPFISKKVVTRHTHGTGCTFAAAITAELAQGRELPEAVRHAKEYLLQAMQAGLAIGHGHGPLHHLVPYYPVPIEKK